MDAAAAFNRPIMENDIMTHVKTRKRKRGLSASKRNYFWDIGIAATFLVVFSQEITGETLHEWLALGLFAGLIAHLLFHWKWVVNISKRIFSPKLPQKTRINYLLNTGLLAGFIFMGVSGLMISESVMPTLGFRGGGDLWEEVHEVAANGTMAMVVGHVLLHTRWLVTNTRKYVLNALAAPVGQLRRVTARDVTA